MTSEEFSQRSKIPWGIANHFRGVTKLIAYVKRWASDHFRGATKMASYGKVRTALYVLGVRRFSTQCEGNLNEVPA